MAITWTRETMQTEASAAVGYTVQQMYDFFGALIQDTSHVRYSNTQPYTNFFYDIFNSGMSSIHAHAPGYRELISCSTVVDSGVYDYADYVPANCYVVWVKYDGGTINKIHPISLRTGDIDGVGEGSMDTSGTPAGYFQEGDHALRLVPIPDAVKTLKVLVAVLPAKVASLSAKIALPAHLQFAPPLYVASFAALFDGKLEISQNFEARFWRLVAKKVRDDVDSVDGLYPPTPGGSKRLAPAWGGNNI